jgi:hypothetical protein
LHWTTPRARNYVGAELHEVVASTATAGAYAVSAEGERRLDVRRL